MDKKVALIILDGWGCGDHSKADAIFQAKTPHFDSYWKNNPNAKLVTYGEDVGLPKGQMGNSEVGHLNIGAGRVVYQDFLRINKEIESKQFHQNLELNAALDYAKKNNKPVHLIGLVSDGGVHSHETHLFALCELIYKKQIAESYVHAFTDGRDCNPKNSAAYINNLLGKIADTNTELVSMIGRYYAMDRDNRWERIQKAYDLLVHGVGEEVNNFTTAIQNSYNEDIIDEFILPKILTGKKGRIQKGDVVICFNFRTDRCRQITEALTQNPINGFNMKPLELYYLTMTKYDENFKNVHIMYDKPNIQNTLGEVLSLNNKKQIRIAETEKYPHVTFFFSGGREAPFNLEKRILVPSPKVSTYDKAPEMSAHEITSKILLEINQKSTDFICLNFANADMVGHTGDYNAIIKAAETVDKCLHQIVEACTSNGYSSIIIADHGNADKALNTDGTPNTAHSMNPVPCILVGANQNIHNGKLADIAPTILELMNIPIPKEMDGNSILS